MTASAPAVQRLINDAFPDQLAAAIADRFALRVETRWDLFAGRYITSRADEEPLTPEQYAFIDAWCLGYEAAMKIAEVAS